MMDIVPVELVGSSVRLRPLEQGDAASLWESVAEGAAETFRWMPTRIACEGDMEGIVARALAERDRGESLPFVTIASGDGAVAGSTRFMNIDRASRRVEIGWTWLSPAHRRSAINTEAKYLMMRHAFEVWGCVRVEYKTDGLNERSRKAIARLGAVEEGTLRRQLVTHEGRFRDTVYFSILADEWPTVKTRLEKMMARKGQ